MGPAFDEWNAIKLNTDHPGVTYLVDVGNSMRDELLAALTALAERLEQAEAELAALKAENEALKAINSRALRVGRAEAADEIARLRADNTQLHVLLADFTGDA